MHCTSLRAFPSVAVCCFNLNEIDEWAHQGLCRNILPVQCSFESALTQRQLLRSNRSG